MNTLYHIGGTFYLGKEDSIKHLTRDAYFDQLKKAGHEKISLLFQALVHESGDYERYLIPFLQEFSLGATCSPFYRNSEVIENPTLWFPECKLDRGKTRTYAENHSAPYIAAKQRDGAYYPYDIFSIEPHTFRQLPQWKWTAETDDGKRMLTLTNLK